MKHTHSTKVYPLMVSECLETLSADIKENGQKTKIITQQGMILDGRGVLLACLAEGIEPQFEEYSGDPNVFVASRNLHRKHLRKSQRAMIVARLVNTRRGSNQHPEISGSLEKQFSQKDAAKRADVSEDMVAFAKEILASGNDAVIRSVDEGRANINAARKTLARLAEEVNKPQGIFESINDCDKKIVHAKKLDDLPVELRERSIQCMRMRGINDVNQLICDALSFSIDELRKVLKCS